MENKQEYLNNLRHSCAHLLAAAVLELFPDTKPAIGPAIENGFYYDFDFATPISEKDLPMIEKKMHEIVKSWDGFIRREITPQEAKKEFIHNPYKQELIDEFSQKEKQLTIYQSGNFNDLCAGGHAQNPKKDLKHFKLLSIAGAYWRGDEKNKMLTRIYGTCFPTKEALDKYLWQIEEAKKRDHRKIGETLELFTINDKVGQGLILWLPKGNSIKEELENWAKETEKKWGYERVTTPHIGKADLYYTSGHLPYYKKDMYPPMQFENEEYFLKPMNCPHHHMIYACKQRSYKELPLRLAEYGTCYRYENSGELFGLMRVRGFTQNDSHIYCSPDQAVNEFVGVMKLHEYYYKTLGINEYHLELALRDEKHKTKYHGDDAMWDQAEKLMREAVAQTNIKMVEQKGNAAFYGPKIDFIIHSSIGREFAASTNQIDLYMGKRFDLSYTDTHGNNQTPVIIHRAPLGSHERFIGFLIEHYAGAFPLWLSPVQVAVLPVSDKFYEYAQKVRTHLTTHNIRTRLNRENKTLGAKIREETLQKVPYMIIIGEKEYEKTKAEKAEHIYISVRTREGKDEGTMTLYQLIKRLKTHIENRL